MSTLHLITHTESVDLDPKAGEKKEIYFSSKYCFFYTFSSSFSPLYFHTAVQKWKSFTAEGGESQVCNFYSYQPIPRLQPPLVRQPLLTDGNH